MRVLRASIRTSDYLEEAHRFTTSSGEDRTSFESRHLGELDSKLGVNIDPMVMVGK